MHRNVVLDSEIGSAPLVENTSQPYRDVALRWLAEYFPHGQELIEQLPVPELDHTPIGELPPCFELVRLPAWAQDLEVAGGILVPKHLVGDRAGEAWEQTYWYNVIFWYLSALAEREHERQHGPIHSCSAKLRGWDARQWQYAWVNRIALFLRRWGATKVNGKEEELFGKLPQAKIVITHDVDAVTKTLAIRSKQAVLRLFGSWKLLRVGKIPAALGRLLESATIFLRNENYWYFDLITQIEEQHGFQSEFYFYGGRGGVLRSPRSQLMDPAYDVLRPRLQSVIRELDARGFQVGLHQAFDSWADPQTMLVERARLERALGKEVHSCRQHWLRFSWNQTWAAQQEAGFLRDATLGFNDRPGFRVGAALSYQPWDFRNGNRMQLEATPTVLMDGQLYYYQMMCDAERAHELKRWIGEVQQVGGKASILWHQRVFGADYGWRQGFEDSLGLMSENEKHAAS